MLLKGSYTALITPFKNGEVDFDGLIKLINYQLANNIDGLLVLGTTGETPTLTQEEQIEIIKVSKKTINGKVPLMVGTGAYSTYKTIENTRIAKELGADIALIVTPYYNKPTDEGLYRHFLEVSSNVDIPIVVYNIQSRTGKNIDTPVLKRIAQLKNIIGVKEASGNINQMMDVIQSIVSYKPDFSVMCGDDALTLPLISVGGLGVISVVSNIVPQRVVKMVNSALNGDFNLARKIHYEILPLIKGIFIETNPIPIKTAMNMLGMPSGEVRLPLCEMQEYNRNKLKSILDSMNLFEIKEVI